jgi:hypothetical protein
MMEMMIVKSLVPLYDSFVIPIRPTTTANVKVKFYVCLAGPKHSDMKTYSSGKDV